MADDSSSDATTGTTVTSSTTKPVYQDTLSTGDNYLWRRRALVGPHCMVNRLNTTVSVASGTGHMDYLVDKDLTNSVDLYNTVKATVVTEPTFSIKDVSRYYAKGTTAGFVVKTTSVVSLSVLAGDMRIYFYKDGNLVGTSKVTQQSGTVLDLKLLSIGGGNTVEYTATAPDEFDEIGLGSTVVLDAKVISSMNVFYAFVGKNGKYYIDKENPGGINDFTSALKSLYGDEVEVPDDGFKLGQTGSWSDHATPDDNGHLINDNNTDIWDLNTLVLSFPVSVSAYGGNNENNMPFRAGMTVGYEVGSAKLIDVANVFKLKTFTLTYDGSKTFNKYTWTDGEDLKGNFDLLEVNLGGGTSDVAATLTKNCNALEIINGGIDVGTTWAYRMFAILPPEVDEEDTLTVSAAQTMCEDMKSVKLHSNRAVTWTCTTDASIVPTADDDTKEVYTVSGLTKAGTYTFVATDANGATKSTTVTYGAAKLYDTATEPWVNNFTEKDVTYSVMSKDDLKKYFLNGFTLIDISSVKDTANLVNGSIDDHASLTTGLQVAGSKVIVGIQRSKALHLDNPTRVGFVLKMNNNLISVNLLNSMKVYAYNAGKKCTEITRDHNFKVLQATIAGESGVQTTEFNVELAGGQDVDQLLLVYNNTLSLDLNSIDIYYAFSEEESKAESFESKQGDQGEIVSYENGARIDEKMLSGFNGVAAVASLKNNYTNFIDGNLTDYLSVTNTVEAASKASVIPVKLGKRYSAGHLIEIHMGKITGLADVDLGDVMKIDAYLGGVKQTDKTTWDAVDLNVIKAGGDYILRWTPNSDFDEIVIRNYAVAELLNTAQKFYGMRIYSDIDKDGVPDYEDDDNCPKVAFLIDENQPKPNLDKIHDFTSSKMYLHRTFAKGKWSTICLPVDMTYNQFAATFGSDARLAAPAKFKDTTPNTVQFYVDKTIGNNVLLHKNMPYIIMVDSLAAENIPDSIVADNDESKKLDAEFASNLGSDTKGAIYLVRGISYSMDENNIATIPEVSFEHTSNRSWQMNEITWHGAFVSQLPIEGDFYSFLLNPTNGAAAQMVHVTGSFSQMRGLRCWMTTDATNSAKEVTLAVGDDIITGDDATGVKEMNLEPTSNGSIYTLSGVLVRRNATTTDGLNKGIYIWNNKKIEVK